MTGYDSKRQMANDKDALFQKFEVAQPAQEPVNLSKARKIAAEYGTPDSQVDDGNLYFALSKCLEHIDAQPAQEPLTEVQIEKGLMALLQCSASELENYSSQLTDGYTDDVKRVVSAVNSTPPLPVQPMQEPVAHVYLFDHDGRPLIAWDNAKGIKIGDKLYTPPPQRTWIWLSDADIAEVVDTTCQYTGGYEEFLIKKAERKIKELNT